MAKLQSRLRSLAISTDGGTTFIPIGHLTDATLNYTVGEISATDSESGDSEEYMPGRSNATIDYTANYNEDDAGQDALITAAINKSIAVFRWRSTTASGAYEEQADGFVTARTQQSPDSGPGDLQKLTGSIRLTGSISRTVQGS